MLKTEDLLKATGPVLDVFSYHSYGAVSKRCAGWAPRQQQLPGRRFRSEWLSRVDRIEAFYAGLRDQFEPGKPLWITETADAACGGDPWASTFLDTFRYLDQLGRMSKRGVQVNIHNTLASSDYGLLDENTLAPRPNYWAALLWRQVHGNDGARCRRFARAELASLRSLSSRAARRRSASRDQYRSGSNALVGTHGGGGAVHVIHFVGQEPRRHSYPTER